MFIVTEYAALNVSTTSYFIKCKCLVYCQIKRNRGSTGSVVECSSRDQGVADLSLTSITALCP